MQQSNELWITPWPQSRPTHCNVHGTSGVLGTLSWILLPTKGNWEDRTELTGRAEPRAREQTSKKHWVSSFSQQHFSRRFRWKLRRILVPAEKGQEFWSLSLPAVWLQEEYSVPIRTAVGTRAWLRSGASWIRGLFSFFPPPLTPSCDYLLLLHSSNTTDPWSPMPSPDHFFTFFFPFALPSLQISSISCWWISLSLLSRSNNFH